MQQLTIKHLGRRLAYGLKVLDGWGDIRTMKYTHLDDENNGFIVGVKPILRNLSDLTKEIEHKGEKFVPIVKLAQLNFGKNYVRTFRVFGTDTFYVEFIGRGDGGGDEPEYLYNKVQFAYSSFHKSFIVGEIEEDGKTFTHCDSIYQLNCLEKLLEWHFHIDEPEGTWIDVNSLPENPYK